MTLPTDKLQGTHVYIKIGDGASPEVFTHPCMINGDRSLKFGSSMQKDIVPDCANPDDPVWESCFVDGLSISVDGSGKLDTSSIATYDTWFRAGTTKNVQIWLGSVGKWAVPMKLTGWQITGSRNKYAEVSLTLSSDGPSAAFA